MALFGKKKNTADNASVSLDKSAEEKPAKGKKEKPVKNEKKAAEPKNTEPKVPVPKARPDIYTLLLGLSVAALVIAVVLLFLNINAYGPNPLSGVPR